MKVSATEVWRVFCAIELPEATRVRLMEHIAKLRTQLPETRASWSRESNIHLTLKFIGELSRGLVPKFESAISRAVLGKAPFPILISGNGAFPNRRDPRVIWIGIQDPNEALGELQLRLEAESEREGFPKEKRRFHPHLTLARLRHSEGARDLAQAHEALTFPAEEIIVNELVLIRSELSSSVSKYTAISRHALKA
ncbi:MAG TPA: RNA 2',3'-cyclic phosphodiesterase [Candidatus Binatia bacterium]|nr:RNA 2',3'-cyclic phosphodiesterase [Candidatus Binatia bacterium]